MVARGEHRKRLRRRTEVKGEGWLNLWKMKKALKKKMRMIMEKRIVKDDD